MSKNKKKIAQLEHRIREEERNFLIEAYARQLVQSLQENSESPDDKAVESLILARPRVAPDLAEEIASLLETNGHEVDRDTSAPEPSSRDSMADLAGAAGGNGAGGDMSGLFEDVELSEEDAVEFFGDEDQAIPLDDAQEEESDEDHEDGDGLFDSDSEEDGEEVEYPEDVEDGDLGDSEEGLFGDDSGDEAAGSQKKKGSKKKKGGKSAKGQGPADDGNGAAVDTDEDSAEVAEEDEEAGVLFNQDIYSGHGKQGGAADEEKTTGVSQSEDIDIEGEIAGTTEEEETPGFDPTQGPESEETPGFTPTEGHEVGETPGFAPTQGHEIEETAGFTPTEGHKAEETPGFTPTEGHEVEETPGFTPSEGHEVEETPGFTPTEGHEVDETPGFTPTQGHEVEETAGFTPTKGHEVEETAGFTPTGGHEVEETAGFTPTQGHEVEETAGFTPTKGHEVEETAGFTPTQGHEVEETAEFTPTKGHEVEETPGFTPTRGPEVGETPGFPPVEGKEKKKGSKKGTPGKEAEKEEKKRGIKPAGGRESKELSAKERMAKAKEELEQRKRQRLAQIQAREKEQQIEEEDEVLDALTYQVSLEDLEKYLGITVVPDDRAALDKRWKQKLQEPCIKTLLQNAESSRIAYALVPRLPRFVKDGKANLNSVVTLLRSHPQIFENVPQVIKYKAEPFFVKELPRLDWAIVSCEALPETRGKNYSQQRVVVKGYAQKHQTTEMRVKRRTLVEALFDMVVIQLVIKEKLLINSVELTDSKVGRMNYACINNGDKGIRVGDVSRQQTHAQLGMCASW